MRFLFRRPWVLFLWAVGLFVLVGWFLSKHSWLWAGMDMIMGIVVLHLGLEDFHWRVRQKAIGDVQERYTLTAKGEGE